MNDLAMTYTDQGKFAQAEPLLLRALAVSRRVKGEEDGGTLIFMSNLAKLWILDRDAGRLADAIDMLERVAQRP